MIIKLDYDKAFDSFINNMNDKALGGLYTMLEAEHDMRAENPDLGYENDVIIPAMRSSAAKEARDNTKPMENIIGVIINKPDFSFESATVEEVKTLAGCVFEQNQPFVFKDDVNEHNCHSVLGYIAGKLAVDLAGKHNMYSDGLPSAYHMPIGIVQAGTNEPLVFDSSDYAKKPEKPGLNPFKYIFSSEYRHNYNAAKSNYKSALESYEAMRSRTETTMKNSISCRAKFCGPREATDVNQAKTMSEAVMEVAMSKDVLDAGVLDAAESTRSHVEGGLNGLAAEEFGDMQERRTPVVKSAPSLSMEAGKK